ncbi:MAG: hypothetical protein DCF30_00395 [Hyphomicrobiales bacterium]|nr:MAG: hypothetical protein DCF30_00395 [Hyphomicrobiales bacterium]
MVKIVNRGGYNRLELTLGVGPGRANNIDDVTYVQFLLNKIVQADANLALRQMCKPHDKKLVVDGIIGPKTKTQIKAFQRHVKTYNKGIIADGCVDKYGLNVSDKEHRYTFFALIMEVMFVCPCSLAGLVNEPDFPPRLAAIGRAVYNSNPSDA